MKCGEKRRSEVMMKDGGAGEWEKRALRYADKDKADCVAVEIQSKSSLAGACKLQLLLCSCPRIRATLKHQASPRLAPATAR